MPRQRPGRSEQRPYYRGRTPERCELLLTFLLAGPIGLMVSRLLLSKVSVGFDELNPP